MKLPEVKNIKLIGIVVAVILIFFYFILGIPGMLAVLGIMLLFIVPTYFILDNFELDQDEKIVFSFFMGTGIFPSIAYWIGMIISFRIAIFITFVVMIAAVPTPSERSVNWTVRGAMPDVLLTENAASSGRVGGGQIKYDGLMAFG